jgi:hypothetical protein
MNEGWKQTGEFSPDGRPFWVCANEPPCKLKALGHTIMPHTHANSTMPPVAADLPCVHRGLVWGKIGPACCRRVVFSCSKHAFCTINPQTDTVNNIVPAICSGCHDREL